MYLTTMALDSLLCKLPGYGDSADFPYDTKTRTMTVFWIKPSIDETDKQND